jgi:hypothetical protein
VTASNGAFADDAVTSLGIPLNDLRPPRPALKLLSPRLKHRPTDPSEIGTPDIQKGISSILDLLGISDYF